jgi:hypothetical protein
MSIWQYLERRGGFYAWMFMNGPFCVVGIVNSSKSVLRSTFRIWTPSKPDHDDGVRCALTVVCRGEELKL